MKKKVGLALEGGGARGAYEAGAIKLLTERGYEFEYACGTSIGAINAAMVAQGGAGEHLYNLWESISYNKIFDIDENKLRSALNKELNKTILKYLSGVVVNTVKEKGIDTAKMRAFVTEYLDEEKIRKSKCGYGLVTVCMSEAKGYELYLEDIPKGKLIDYVLASGRLPGFRQETLDGKYYMDGGMYNNCPINMVERKGIKEIIAVRVGSNFATKDEKKLLKRKDLKITIIEPKFELPNILAFDNQIMKYLLNLGYYDAIKKLDNLLGDKYYIEDFNEDFSFNTIISLDSKKLNEIYKMLKLKNVSDSKKVFLEVVLPLVLKKIDKENLSTYKEAILALLEYTGEYLGINEFKVRDIKTFILEIKEELSKLALDKKVAKVDQVIFSIIKNIKV